MSFWIHTKLKFFRNNPMAYWPGLNECFLDIPSLGALCHQMSFENISVHQVQNSCQGIKSKSNAASFLS